MFITKPITWIYAIMAIFGAHVEGFQMNMTQYFKMPSMYNFDDYDRCLQNVQHFSVYCFVRVDVLPQPQAEAWQAIQDISKYDRHHFDHSHLYYGICVEWCKSKIDDLDNEEADALNVGILTNNTKVNIYLNLFKSEAANRQLLNQLMNQCVNLDLKNYGLSAESVIEYCNKNNNILEDDSWNFIFYAIMSVLTLLVVASSLFDYHLKNKTNDKILTDRDHYKSPPIHIGRRICVAFSMTRNWYRLNQEPNGKTGRELRFLDCFKFFAMFIVIFAHTTWVFYESAISNPQDSERLTHTYVSSFLVSGSLVTVTFFVIGGFLLAITWLTVCKENNHMTFKQYLGIFLKFNIFRYIRLTIPYAFVILWSGVYFDNVGGPLYRHILEREQLACRKNWWINLLYLNNYINTSERCLLQGWYLASDTQSFFISIIILMLAHRFSKIRNWIFGATVAFFWTLPGVVAYFKNFSPIFIPKPQLQRDSFMESRAFNEFYVPFHMNFGAYFFGVLTALAYDHVSSNQIKLKQNNSFHMLFYVLIPLGILWMFSGHTFLQDYNDNDMRIWASIYASFHRNVWGLGLGIFIVGMSVKCGWVLRKFCCLPIFRVLGRLTYGTFMVHLLISRVAIATIRQPIFFGTGIMFAFIVFTMCTSYIVSFFLAIILELPVSSLLKLLR